MPTEKKVALVEDLKSWMEGSTITISTDYTRLRVGDMTELRRILRDKGVRFRVVKNTLTYLAADAAGRPELKEIVQGPTGLAFGYGDPSEPAKALSDYIRVSRSPLTIKGAVMGDRALTGRQVEQLATLPSKDVLVSQLLGQMQAPISNLVYVLSGPVSALTRVLQRHVEQLQAQE